MRVLPFQIEYPFTDIVRENQAFFEHVKYDYLDFLAQGFFRSLSGDGFVVYQIEGSEHTLTGLVACAAIEDYREKCIKGHEHTIRKEEAKQAALLQSRGSAIKPVLLAYDDNTEISNWCRAFIDSQGALYELTFGREIHRFWPVCDEGDIVTIRQMFEQVPAAYIADGHHRAASTAHFQEHHRNDIRGLLSLFVPASELVVWAFHRVITGLNGHTAAQLLDKIAEVGTLTFLPKAGLPSARHDIHIWLAGKWHLLRWHPKLRQDNDALDVTLLNNHIIGPILGITDVRSDPRIRYVEGTLGIGGLMAALPDKPSIAFAMHPLQVTDIMRVADAGLTLPPKSTWFEPRIKNGVVVYPFR